jgi:hypothetical protein
MTWSYQEALPRLNAEDTFTAVSLAYSYGFPAPSDHENRLGMSNEGSQNQPLSKGGFDHAFF